MTARYDPNAPIETLFAQIADGVAYAELGEAPFTSKQVVDIRLLYLAKTGVFYDDLKEWNRFPLLDRTWPKFRVHFPKRTASGGRTHASPRDSTFQGQMQ